MCLSASVPQGAHEWRQEESEGGAETDGRKSRDGRHTALAARSTQHASGAQAMRSRHLLPAALGRRTSESGGGGAQDARHQT